MNISQNIRMLLEELPKEVQLIAVSKTQTAEKIMAAYNAGQRLFGENKAQEAATKAGILPADIEWHFIGHLQTNKVKLIVPFVHTIHSIDSVKVIREVNREAEKKDRIIRCLLQFYIATEETKFGLDRNEAVELIGTVATEQMKNIEIAGVMGMASYTSNTHLIREEFKNLNDTFHWLKNNYFQSSTQFKEISMGMSGDYLLAIKEGSTLIRLGTAIFGER